MMVAAPSDIGPGQTYRYRGTSELVQVVIVVNRTVHWRALNSYIVQGHKFGQMGTAQFLSAFEFVEPERKVRKA